MSADTVCPSVFHIYTCTAKMVVFHSLKLLTSEMLVSMCTEFSSVVFNELSSWP